MLCYAMLCYAMLCYATLRYAMLCYGLLCCAVLCYAMLCHRWVQALQVLTQIAVAQSQLSKAVFDSPYAEAAFDEIVSKHVVDLTKLGQAILHSKRAPEKASTCNVPWGAKYIWHMLSHKPCCQPVASDLHFIVTSTQHFEIRDHGKFGTVDHFKTGTLDHCKLGTSTDPHPVKYPVSALLLSSVCLLGTMHQEAGIW